MSMHVREAAETDLSPISHPRQMLDGEGSGRVPAMASPALAPYRVGASAPNVAQYLRSPDFYSVSVSLPVAGPLGVHAALTLDRKGKLYGGLGVHLGISAGFPVNVSAAYINQTATPGKDTLRNKLSGLGFGVAAGAGPVVSRSPAGGSSTVSLTNGATIGVSSTFSILLSR